MRETHPLEQLADVIRRSLENEGEFADIFMNILDFLNGAINRLKGDYDRLPKADYAWVLITQLRDFSVHSLDFFTRKDFELIWQMIARYPNIVEQTRDNGYMLTIKTETNIENKISISDVQFMNYEDFQKQSDFYGLTKYTDKFGHNHLYLRGLLESNNFQQNRMVFISILEKMTNDFNRLLNPHKESTNNYFRMRFVSLCASAEHLAGVISYFSKNQEIVDIRSVISNPYAIDFEKFLINIGRNDIDEVESENVKSRLIEITRMSREFFDALKHFSHIPDSRAEKEIVKELQSQIDTYKIPMTFILNSLGEKTATPEKRPISATEDATGERTPAKKQPRSSSKGSPNTPNPSPYPFHGESPRDSFFKTMTPEKTNNRSNNRNRIKSRRGLFHKPG